MLGILTQHAKWGEVLSNALCIFHLYNSAEGYSAQHHFSMLINVKKNCYNHVVYAYVVLLIISIDPRGIATTIIHKYAKLTNKKFSNICWFFQGTVLIDSHTSVWMFFILWCC